MRTKSLLSVYKRQPVVSLSLSHTHTHKIPAPLLLTAVHSAVVAMEKWSCNYMLLFVAALVALLFIKTVFSKHSGKARRLPPSPPSLPVIGHLHLLRPPEHQSLHKLALRYGPLIHLRLGYVPYVLASSPEAARQLLRTHDAAFSNRPQSTASRRFAYDSAGFAFAPYGPYWRFMKKLCMSELLSGRTVENLFPVRRRELIDLLRTLSKKSSCGENFNLSSELVKMMNNVITRMTASTTSAGKEGEEARKVAKEVAQLIGTFNIGDFVPALRRWDLQGLDRKIGDVHRRFDALMERIIKGKEEARRKRKKNGGGEDGVKDLLDIMLDASEDDNAEVKLTRENIKGFILDIFTAGSDSTPATIEWALAELINHPATLIKVREEIDRVVGKHRLVEETDISKMPYLEAVVKETLRLHPAAPMVLRESTIDVDIGDYYIPANTGLIINTMSLGRDPSYWEDPQEFKPERFVDESQGSAMLDFRGQHFQFLPFGSGKRVCPGTTLALQVVQSTLAALVQCFKWEVGGRKEGEVVLDMMEGGGMVTTRVQPLVCVPVARLDPLPLNQP